MRTLSKLATFLFLLCGSYAFAQGGEIEDQQIIIEKDKPLTLPKAGRIYKRTNIKSITTESEPIEYQIIQPSYDFQPYFADVSFRNYEERDQKSKQEFENFVKAGYGNYNSPLFQGYLGLNNENNEVGLWLNHESYGKGPVRDGKSAYGLTEVLLSGAYATELFYVKPQISYQREGYYPYGLTPPKNFDYAATKIGASTLGFSADLGFKPSRSLKIVLTPAYKNARMKFQDRDPFNKEGQFLIGGSIDYNINDDFGTGLKTGFIHLDYAGGLEQTRTIFDIYPYVDFQNERLYFKGGATVATLSGDLGVDESSVNFYPDLEAKFQMSNKFGLFATLNGNLKPVSLTGLELQNRYLEDSLTFLNENTNLHFKGGVEVGIGEKLRLKGFLGFKQTKNKALFIPSSSDTSRFTVLYDSGNFKQFTIGGEALYMIHPNTNITLDARVSGYTPDTVEEPWYLPVVVVNLGVFQTFAEAFKVRFGMKVLGGIKGMKPVTNDLVPLDPIVDLNMGMQYDVQRNISVFIDFNNLLSKNYEWYLNYPSRGLMVKGGGIYRF